MKQAFWGVPADVLRVQGPVFFTSQSYPVQGIKKSPQDSVSLPAVTIMPVPGWRETGRGAWLSRRETEPGSLFPHFWLVFRRVWVHSCMLHLEFWEEAARPGYKGRLREVTPSPKSPESRCPWRQTLTGLCSLCDPLSPVFPCLCFWASEVGAVSKPGERS